MEFKVIIYILGAIIYFLYTLNKRNVERKKGESQPDKETVPPTVKPGVPSPDPLTEIMREIKRKQEEALKNTIPQNLPVPYLVSKPKPPKEILVKQKRKGLFEEGNYERELTEEEKIVRGNLKIENEGIYKIEPAEIKEQEEAAFHINMRDAVIGSIVLDRKY